MPTIHLAGHSFDVATPPKQPERLHITSLPIIKSILSKLSFHRLSCFSTASSQVGRRIAKPSSMKLKQLPSSSSSSTGSSSGIEICSTQSTTRSNSSSSRSNNNNYEEVEIGMVAMPTSTSHLPPAPPPSKDVEADSLEEKLSGGKQQRLKRYARRNCRVLLNGHFTPFRHRPSKGCSPYCHHRVRQRRLDKPALINNGVKAEWLFTFYDVDGDNSSGKIPIVERTISRPIPVIHKASPKKQPSISSFRKALVSTLRPLIVSTADGLRQLVMSNNANRSQTQQPTSAPLVKAGLQLHISLLERNKAKGTQTTDLSALTSTSSSSSDDGKADTVTTSSSESSTAHRLFSDLQSPTLPLNSISDSSCSLVVAPLAEKMDDLKLSGESSLKKVPSFAPNLPSYVSFSPSKIDRFRQSSPMNPKPLESLVRPVVRHFHAPLPIKVQSIPDQPKISSLRRSKKQRPISLVPIGTTASERKSIGICENWLKRNDEIHARAVERCLEQTSRALGQPRLTSTTSSVGPSAMSTLRQPQFFSVSTLPCKQLIPTSLLASSPVIKPAREGAAPCMADYGDLLALESANAIMDSRRVIKQQRSSSTNSRLDCCCIEPPQHSSTALKQPDCRGVVEQSKATRIFLHEHHHFHHHQL